MPDLPSRAPRNLINLPSTNLRKSAHVPENLDYCTTDTHRSHPLLNGIRVTVNNSPYNDMVNDSQPLNRRPRRLVTSPASNSDRDVSVEKQKSTSLQKELVDRYQDSFFHQQIKSTEPNGGALKNCINNSPRTIPNSSPRKKKLIKSQKMTSSPDSTRTPKVYPMKYSVGSLTLPTSSPFDVVVCFSKSPDKFYFQLESVMGTIEKTQKKIQDAASNADGLGPTFIGCPCFAQYEGDWYRGEVIQLCDPNDVGVRYVDYGNTAKIANTENLIRKMEFEFTQYPFFAIAAKLAGVLPLQNDAWSQSVKEKFKTLTENRILSLKPVGYEKELLCVKLEQPKAQGMDLAQYMIKRKLAKKCEEQQKSNERDSVRFPNTPVIRDKSMPFVITSPPPPLGTIPSLTCKSPLNLPVANSPQSAVSMSKPPPIILELDSGSQIHFTVNVGFDRNFCVGTLISKPEDQKALEFNSFALALETIRDFDPPVGTVVAAHSLEYDEWFRACIVSANKNVYTVIYIDYGNFEDGIVAVKPIPDTYCEKELAVKLAVVGDESVPAHSYFLDNLTVGTAHWLEIVGEEDNIFVVRFNYEETSTYKVKFESWTSLMKQQPIPTQTQQQVIEGRRCDPGFICEALPVVIEDLENFFIMFYDDLEASKEIQAKIRNTLASCPPLPRHPVVGSYAITIFPEDGDYYRAKVISVEGESVHVRYIDFGNSAIVELKELKVMPEDLFNYHACATRVTLSRVPRLLGALPLSIRSCLEDCINQLFTIFVLPSTEPSSIECTLSKDGEVLNDTILELLESSRQSEFNQGSESMQTIGKLISIL